MRTIAKFYVSAFKQWPGSDAGQLELQAVCRGEENKTWAAATPAGSLSIPSEHPDGAAAMAAFSISGAPEVHVLIEADPAGEWELKACEFAYAGVQVKFDRTKRAQGDYRPGELTMTVNNTDATKALRQAYADSLMAGEPARFRVWTEPVPV
jgi:hypothetical protein